jgi:nitrogenase molybdenum-iron protein NifN
MPAPDTLHKRTATENACKVCAPLGACIALKGIEATIPLLHGSQGCSTYIRRYLIGHFREPIDIASSSFSEATAIFGGRDNLFRSLDNIITQYHPKLIGIATTCLSETIGEDISLYVNQYLEQNRGKPLLPRIVHVATPSYAGSHSTGFKNAQIKLLATLAEKQGPKNGHVVFLPTLVSPEDLRLFRAMFNDFGLSPVFVPDYSETLDSGLWEELELIQEGGTPIELVKEAGGARATIEIGADPGEDKSGGTLLQEKFGVQLNRLCLPIGIRQTDLFFKTLEALSGAPAPAEYSRQRQRLVDSYVDGHKFLFDKKAVIFGDAELVAGLVSFALETGLRPVVVATGDSDVDLKSMLGRVAPELDKSCLVLQDTDFARIDQAMEGLRAEIIIGNSKGYILSRKYGIPLVRVGFPIQDRIGAQRLLHVGYAGTQQLFDRIANALIEKEQDGSPVGYMTY